MTAVLTWLKGKLFSQSGVFLAVLVGFLLLFIIPNTDTILSKFGFETKTNLKGDLVATQKDLKTVVETNKSLVSTGKIQEENHQSAITVVTSNAEAKIEIEKKVETINKKANKVVQPAIASLKMTQIITSTTVTLDKIKVDEVSKANIDALNETFDELFGPARS